MYIADIDDCENSTCVNGGTCLGAVNSYACLCAPGYSGSGCETGKEEITAVW
jgi:hypothetical protein